MKINLTLFWIVLFLLPLSLAGQRTITGSITDAESGEPLIGATVLLLGTPSGVVSDFDGNYSIELPDDMTSLAFSYTGYAPQEIIVGASNILDVQMSAGSILDEVVVIGYGKVKREDATGAIQTVDAKTFNKGAITSPQDLLAGKVAGVQITQNSGAPGEGSTIRIRGGSSLSASNDPLIVIDGIPIDNGGVAGSRNVLNTINPNDIETFTVLKDASATAIYGSRASNGVILITTKKGNLDQPLRIDYSGNISFSNIIETVDVLSADEFRTQINQQYPDGHPAPTLLGDTKTNWQDQIYETAIGTDHSLSLSGGIAKVVPYRLSLGYSDKNGILKTDNFNRTTAALNLSPGFLDNTLQINLNVKGMRTKNRFANRGAIGSAIAFDPTQPINQENEFGNYFTFTDVAGNPNTLAPQNPLALLDLTDNVSEVSRVITNATIDYRFSFLPELRANLNLAYDYAKGSGTTNIPTFAPFAFNRMNGGGVDNEYEETKKNELLEFYLNYVKEFGQVKLDVMGGYSWQRFFFDITNRNSNVAGTPEVTTITEDKGELYLLSLFSRVNLTAFDKYLFTFTLRRDGVSRFSPEKRWGLFPAAAVAYKILDDEDGALNNLKLRLGYGVTGQQDIGGFYEYLPRYLSSFGNAEAQFGEEFIQTLRPEGYDANIKWEETTTYNIGLDFGLFKDRLYGSLEVYQRNTKDLLNFIPVPAGTNLTNFINTNVGNLENRGVELSLTGVPVQTKDLRWEISGNVTRNENKITKLIASDDPEYQGVLTGGISGGVGSSIQIHSVGFPVSSFFVFEQVYDESGRPIEGLYVDRNGDGKVTPEDMYRLEKPAPDFLFGFTSNLSYKNFNFSFAGRANVGNYVYNNIQSNRTHSSLLFHPSLYLSNALGSINEVGFTDPQFLSSHFIQNGSFIRLDHMTLSYDLNNVFAGKGGLTVSATLQNPLLITDYTGIDPEIGNGIDNNFYPRARTILFGVNARF